MKDDLLIALSICSSHFTYSESIREIAHEQTVRDHRLTAMSTRSSHFTQSQANDTLPAMSTMVSTSS